MVGLAWSVEDPGRAISGIGFPESGREEKRKENGGWRLGVGDGCGAARS